MFISPTIRFLSSISFFLFPNRYFSFLPKCPTQSDQRQNSNHQRRKKFTLSRAVSNTPVPPRSPPTLCESKSTEKYANGECSGDEDSKVPSGRLPKDMISMCSRNGKVGKEIDTDGTKILVCRSERSDAGYRVATRLDPCLAVGPYLWREQRRSDHYCTCLCVSSHRAVSR